MTKLQHVHKWALITDFCGGAWMRCDCGTLMTEANIERGINAVEKFSLQDAIQVLWDLEHAAGVSVGSEYEALEDYIAELDQ